MSPTIKANYETDEGIISTTCEVNLVPDTCPLCRKGIQPIYRFGWAKFQDRRLWVVFECPKRDCGRLFISYYYKPVGAGIPKDTYYFQGSAPWNIEKKDFPEEVAKISPKFCEIYNQAKEAEERELEEICGAGYRRALEFLIKDYLIKEKVDKPKIIKETRLGTCIENYIKFDNLKHCAKRAAWLGNDETHYIRIWKDKDLNDLKDLIQLTANWIHDVHLTERIKKKMPEKKPK